MSRHKRRSRVMGPAEERAASSVKAAIAEWRAAGRKGPSAAAALPAMALRALLVTDRDDDHDVERVKRVVMDVLMPLPPASRRRVINGLLADAERRRATLNREVKSLEGQLAKVAAQ